MSRRRCGLIQSTLTHAFVLMCLVTMDRLPQAQQTAAVTPTQPQQTSLAGGIRSIAATEPSSNIRYVRLILEGSLHAPGEAAANVPPPNPPPLLIAQCSLQPEGKYIFETFASFGGPVDLKFYPPWKLRNPPDPPRRATTKVSITMNFLGYTHVKPLRRQWEIPLETPSLYRYNPPGFRSSNLEEASYILRYLVSLPTLEITLDDHTAEFQTTPLLSAIRNEPLCRAAGL